MSLVTPESIQELQRKLYLKAKQEPVCDWLVYKDRVGLRGECRCPLCTRP